MVDVYADENVEAQIVEGLRARGIDILSAEEDNHRNTGDSVILNRARELQRIAFSRDQDFLREAVRRQRAGEAFSGVVYAHKAKVSIGQCIEDLALLSIAGESADFAERVYFLPL